MLNNNEIRQLIDLNSVSLAITDQINDQINSIKTDADEAVSRYIEECQALLKQSIDSADKIESAFQNSGLGSTASDVVTESSVTWKYGNQNIQDETAQHTPQINLLKASSNRI